MNSVETHKVSQLMEYVLKARTSKEMGDQEFNVFLADDASRNLGRFMPQRYPEFPYAVAQYVVQRLAAAQRDPASHKLVAEFVMKCVRVREENKSSLETLRWAAKTLASVGLVERKAYLENAEAEFSGIRPPHDLADAVRVLEMDSTALASMARGR